MRDHDEALLDVNVTSEDYIWHPFVGRYRGPVISIDRGDGVFLYDNSGKAYVDLISSWWVNLYGHANPFIAKAIADQAARMEHVIFSGFTHDPAINLCRGLRSLLPQKLSRFFFSDNGSTSVEVALKMAYQYWDNKGDRKRDVFLAFEGGYHGDTWAAMSAGKGSGFNGCFEKFMLPVHLLPYANTWEGDADIDEKELSALIAIRDYLDREAHRVIALIIEPLVQGAGGMRVCRYSFLEQLLRLMKDYGVLVVFDEVMTGFGRTGGNFVVDRLPEALLPDFLCLSKGITGGFLPLAVTVVQDHIYASFTHSGNGFNHGHSYTANPVACAAAVASLHLLDGYQDRIQVIGQVNRWVVENLLQSLSGLIEKVRVIGTIIAFELASGVRWASDLSMGADSVMQALYYEFLKAGLLLRPLGRVIYTIPPYCITNSQLRSAYSRIAEVMCASLVHA